MWVMGFNEDRVKDNTFYYTAVTLPEELRHDFETRLQETIEMHKILSNEEVDLVHEWRRLDEIGQHFIMSVIRHELDRIKK
jgi:hypothetical protein